MALPEKKHNSGFPDCVHLSVEFNQHAVYYQSVDHWVSENERDGGGWFDWVNSEERQRAIDTNSVWTCQWYPETPTGFCAVAASSFNVLMEDVIKLTAQGEK